MRKILFTLAFTAVSFLGMAQDIFQAARTNDVAGIEQAVAQGADLNKGNSRGFTPLILAIYNANEEAALWLLKNGANPNAQDASGNTALMGAIFKGYPKLAEALVANGAHVNLVNLNQASPLVFAATFGQKAIAELLLKKGANKDLKDNSGKTALDHARLQENTELITLLQ